jgi:DNA replication protein DnaC
MTSAQDNAQRMKEPQHVREAIESVMRAREAHRRLCAVSCETLDSTRKEQRRARWIEAAAVVPKRAMRSLAALKRSGCVKRVHTWLRSESWCLVMSGDPGCGKTVAAAYACAHLGGCAWISAAELMRMSMYDSGAWTQLATCKLLVVDDLGSEFVDGPGSMLARLDGVLDDRYRREKKTLITTNLSPSSFKQRYKERIADRVRDGGLFFISSDKSMRGVKHG